MHEAELHCHTIFSKGTPLQPIECITTPLELLEAAKRCGLQMIAITDHNTMAGYNRAKKIAKRFGITVIPAEEIDVAEGGHILAYGIRAVIPAYLPARDVVTLIHRQGGIAVVAHPYDILHPMNALTDIIHDIDGAEFDTIGTMNNRMAQKKLVRSMQHGLFTTGSDAHTTRVIGAFRMVFSDDCRTTATYLQAMKTRQCSIRIAMPRVFVLFFGFFHIIHMVFYNFRHRATGNGIVS